MSGVELTGAERKSLFDTLADTAGRSYGPDALLRQVESILTARLAAVEAERNSAIRRLRELQSSVLEGIRAEPAVTQLADLRASITALAERMAKASPTCAGPDCGGCNAGRLRALLAEVSP